MGSLPPFTAMGRRVNWIGVYRRTVFAVLVAGLLPAAIYLGWQIAVGAFWGFILAVVIQVMSALRSEGEDPFAVWR